MGRNYLANRAGDAVNALLAAASYNFHLLVRWLELLLSQIPAGSESNARPSMGLKIENFTDEDEFDETIEELSRRIALNLSP